MESHSKVYSSRYNFIFCILLNRETDVSMREVNTSNYDFEIDWWRKTNCLPMITIICPVIIVYNQAFKSPTKIKGALMLNIQYSLNKSTFGGGWEVSRWIVFSVLPERLRDCLFPYIILLIPRTAPHHSHFSTISPPSSSAHRHRSRRSSLNMCTDEMPEQWKGHSIDINLKSDLCNSWNAQPIQIQGSKFLAVPFVSNWFGPICQVPHSSLWYAPDDDDDDDGWQ